MSPIDAFILGLIQGITEFFPVSSSAHLELAKHLLGLTSEESSPLFDLVCHFGTLLALIWCFKTKIIELLLTPSKRWLYFFVALLPLIPAYFLLKPARLALAGGPFMGIFLFCTGICLFLAQRVAEKIKTGPSETFLKDVAWIGTAQSLALFPGLSRSAMTISCARMRGWTPKDAVHFSFLLSIPTVLGGMALETLHMVRHPFSLLPISIYLLGFLSSFIFGSIAVRFALSILEKGYLRPFGWYCLFLGGMATIYLRVYG